MYSSHHAQPQRARAARRQLLRLLCLVIAATAAIVAVAAASSRRPVRPGTAGTAKPAAAPRAATPTVNVALGSSTVGPPVAAGFVGLATEYWNIEKETGTDPKQPDYAFEQALRNLAPQGGFNLRIGGDSTDWTWWPITGMKQPPWVRFTITPTWAAVAARLVKDLRAHVMLGINMEADNLRIATTEVHQLGSVFHFAPVTFELGNEPELYSHFPFYHDATGAVVLGRPKTFSLLNMATQWNQLANALPAARFAGPGYAGLDALPYVSPFLSESHRLSLVTVHTYPLHSTRCVPQRPQVGQLFTTASLQTLAAHVANWASLAHQHGVGLRVDEMNSITCGGQPGVTNTFGPALWALNILPLYAQAGVNGVNFQSRPYTAQNLIQTDQTRSGWQILVQPEYYGLMAFAQLAPPGAKMLQVGAMPSGLYAWADRTPQGQTHVVVTNVNSTPSTVTIPAAGAGPPAQVEVLSAGAGGLWAMGGVKLGGQAISPQTGGLTGTPVAQTVNRTSGAYDVTVAPDSAAIVTF